VFALSETNALINGGTPLGPSPSDFFVASLKKVIPSRNRTFVEAKTTVTADFKKAESIKLMNEAGEKIHQSIKDGKALEEVGKENNLAVTKLGPFDSVGGAIPGLANKANREDVRTQALGLDVGAISELITSSTDSSDLASEEAAFVVKLTGKNAVSKDRFDAEFAGYLKGERSAAASQSYSAWLRDETAELYKYSLKTYVDGEGGIKVNNVKSDDGDVGFYKQGTTVTLEAKPAANFVFKEWSGAVTVGTGNAINEVTVLRNSNVTATFVKKDAK
jgi:carbon monoxide dehydrogenase subunit G